MGKPSTLGAQNLPNVLSSSRLDLSPSGPSRGVTHGQSTHDLESETREMLYSSFVRRAVMVPRVFTRRSGVGLVAAALCLSTLNASPTSAAGTVKVGVLQSLTGTMAISEVTVKNATLLAIDQINAAGGVLGKQIEPVVEDGASDPVDVRAKGAEADPARQGRDGVRRLDLGQPQGDAAGVRALQGTALVSGSVRRQRMLARYHVFRRAAEPADSAGAAMGRREGLQEHLLARARITSSRAPPT